MNSKMLAVPAAIIILVAAIAGVGVYWLTLTPPVQSEKVVTVGISGAPPSLDATSWTGMQLQTIGWAIYDRLVEIDTNLNIVPGLAKSWTVSDDGLTWTFYLRSGVKFHDGTDFNAAAVKYNVDRIINEQLPNAYKLYMYVKETRVINSTVVQFVTNTTFPALLTHLAYVVSGISSPTALAAHPGNYSYYAAGTGPYKLNSYIPGSKIELVSNEGYWGDKPKLDRLIFLVVTDPSTRVIAIQRGDIQLVETLPIEQYDSLKASGDVETKVEYERFMFLMLNNHIYDKKVRLAMNYAINKTAIIEGLFKGSANVARCPIPPLTLMAINSCTPFPYNPTLARQLLDEAGYPNGLNVTLETTSGRYVYDSALSQIVQDQLAEVGINVNIVVNEYSTHFSRLRNPPETFPQMALVGWGTSTGDPDYFITQVYYSKVMPPLSLNPGYQNATVDTLIEQGASETNLTRRAEIYAEVQNLVWEDVPMVWLYTQPTIYAWSSSLHGVQIMPTGAINMRGAYLD